MKYTLLLIIGLVIAAYGCKSPGSGKSKVKTKDMVHLSALKGNAELKVGQKAYYTATVHGSVGKTAKAWSGDEEILALIDEKFEYDNKPKPGETGGDRGKRTYIFEAKKAGYTAVLVEHGFRGKVEEKHEIEVTVKE